MYRHERKRVTELLVGDRPERFPYERAIQLFQFQVWMLFPNEASYVKTAGLTAAAKILEHIAENIFVGEVDEKDRKEKLPWELGIINLNDQPPQRMDRILKLREDFAYRAVHDAFWRD